MSSVAPTTITCMSQNSYNVLSVDIASYSFSVTVTWFQPSSMPAKVLCLGGKDTCSYPLVETCSLRTYMLHCALIMHPMSSSYSLSKQSCLRYSRAHEHFSVHCLHVTVAPTLHNVLISRLQYVPSRVNSMQTHIL